MNATPSDELLRAASDWFARMSGGGATASDRIGHEAWLSANPEHRKAYEFVVESCALAARGALGGTTAANDPVSTRSLAVPQVSGARQARGRWLAGTLAASVAIAFVAGVAFRESLRTKHYETSTGETRSITLEDGSIAVLNAASRLSVNFRRDARRIELQEGAALFTVAKDPARPFRVHAGDRTIQAVGTKFEVDRHGTAVDVAVNEGIVAVSVPATESGASTSIASGAVIRLAQGQAVTYISGGSIEAPRRISPEQVGAWRSGLLIYERAPFSWVVGDLNRQFKGSISVEDAQLASMPVNLTLRVHDRATTIRTLEKILPVRAQYDGPDTIRFVRENP